MAERQDRAIPVQGKATQEANELACLGPDVIIAGIDIGKRVQHDQRGLKPDLGNLAKCRGAASPHRTFVHFAKFSICAMAGSRDKTAVRCDAEQDC